jgi:predicted HicB family RNase H-like nuclease
MKSKFMKYKDYIGTIEPDIDSGVLFGRVIGIRDVITFQGDTVPELLEAFHDSVDDYLAFCKERGEGPEKPYSGKFVLRLDPRLHRKLAIAAEARGLSLNDLVKGTLRRTMSSKMKDKVGGLGKMPAGKKDPSSRKAAKIRPPAAGRPPKK